MRVLSATQRLTLGLLAVSAFGSSLAAPPRQERGGWVYVRLEGSPNRIGFTYGSQLAPEIDDAIRMEKMYLKATTKQEWSFYREASQRMFWRKLDPEYKAEISGIAAGMRSRGYKYDANDLLAHNSWIELAWYYEPLWESHHKKAQLVSKAPDSCSAFIATGSQTKDGKIVMAHNAWIDYVVGERWNAILDIHPTHGHRILMDAIPGFIHSGDDFAVSSAGIMVTETTIAGAVGFDVNGTPEFERMRRAIQYSDNLDDFARIMTKGNNGGYANTWLVGDTKSNEIGELQLALKNVVFRRSSEGAYVSANFPQDPKLIAEDCEMDVNKGSTMCSDRHTRWNTLMKQYKGKIDAKAAMAFLADHHNEVTGADGSSASTLCGHWETDSRKGFVAPFPDYTPGGSVQGKVTTSDMANKMSFWARLGHPCGDEFLVGPFLEQHPEFKWELPFLHDMKAHPWTLFAAKP
ncbi:MAG TPA: C45 family peptidase [Fimbriimonadaceae bacterium]|nr:C45 family peptidase [Fimbriimonadaceae bacterium]